MGRLRKKISIEEISKKGPSQIIDDISNTRYSLLRSLGCWQLNIIFFWVRIACRFFLDIAEIRAKSKRYHGLKHTIALRNSLGTIFARGAPFLIDNPDAFPILEKREEREYLDCGLVIGFNHPSLGEVIRLMAICMINYDTKRYLFPVNIVWFEALAPVIDRLSAYGFTLMPVITPSAKETIERHCRYKEALGIIDTLASGFSRAYIDRSAEFIRDKQIVLVAPSARRKLHIFSAKSLRDGNQPIEPQTMTLLARSLGVKRINYAVLPLAVIPPRSCSRGLNLLKCYQFSPCKIMMADEVNPICKEREVHCEGRRFERYFLEEIAQMLEHYSAYDMLYGPD